MIARFFDRFWFLALVLAVGMTEVGYALDPYYHRWSCWTVYAWPIAAALFGRLALDWRKLSLGWEDITGTWQRVAESSTETARMATDLANAVLQAREDDEQ